MIDLSDFDFRIVLAAAIPFFQGLFLSPHPSEDKETVLEIDGVDPNVIISIIEWAYTGDLNLHRIDIRVSNADFR